MGGAKLHPEKGLEPDSVPADRQAERLLGADFSTNFSFHSTNDRSGNGFSEASALSEDMEFQPRSRLAGKLPDIGLALKSIRA